MKEKKWVVGAAAAVLVTSVLGIGIARLSSKAAAPLLEDRVDRASYGLGVLLAKNARRVAGELKPELIERGLRETLAGGKLMITEEELRTTLVGLRNDTREAQQKLAADNLKAGQAFLAENGKKDGVVTTPTGLQYKVLKPGTGPTPSDADTVECNFRATLTDGTEFDGSQRAGEPSNLAMNRLIRGWREALKRMPVGSRWEVVVPSQLAYGKTGLGDRVGPNATLIFDIELVSIVNPTVAGQAAQPSTHGTTVVARSTAPNPATVSANVPPHRVAPAAVNP